MNRPFIWIVDTGIARHPALNLVPRPYAKSFIFMNSWVDDNGHGTHVAGIAGAKRMRIGKPGEKKDVCIGVSPGAGLVPLKVLDRYGNGIWHDVLGALNHIATFNRSGDVVNMSFGGYNVTDCATEVAGFKDALDNLASKGNFIVMSAGNNGPSARLNFPGCLDGTNQFTVAAVDCGGACAEYSNYDAPPVDWAAVGTAVFSTWKSDIPGEFQYNVRRGTSMSAAVISGVIHSRRGAPVAGGTAVCPPGTGATYSLGRR